MKADTLLIAPDYPKELAPRNGDLVGYVITRSGQVVKTSIITRGSLAVWFHYIRHEFNPNQHKFVVGTVSLVGEVLDDIPTDMGAEKAKGGYAS